MSLSAIASPIVTMCSFGWWQLLLMWRYSSHRKHSPLAHLDYDSTSDNCQNLGSILIGLVEDAATIDLDWFDWDCEEVVRLNCWIWLLRTGLTVVGPLTRVWSDLWTYPITSIWVHPFSVAKLVECNLFRLFLAFITVLYNDVGGLTINLAWITSLRPWMKTAINTSFGTSSRCNCKALKVS